MAVTFDPRYYQQQSFESTEQLLMQGMSSINIMATGTGKTHVIGMLTDSCLSRHGRVLVLAHNGLLLNQADAKIYSHAGLYPEREQASMRASHYAQIVTASVASLQGARLARFPKDHFELIIIDECHRSVAKSYTNIFEHFDTAKRVGFTATGDRPDEKSLSTIYDAVAYEYSLAQAIRDHFLCPITGRKVDSFEMDLSELKLSGGDFSEKELEQVIEKFLVPITANVLKETEDRNKVLLFLPDVKSAELIAETFVEIGYPCGCVSGKLSDKKNNDELALFHAGEYKYMASCQKLIEGYDEPAIDCVVMLRPTLSRIVYSQAVGRGTRPHETKSNLLLLEFTFNSVNHKLVSAFELTGGTFDKRIVEEAERLVSDSTEDVDILEYLENCEATFYSVSKVLARANPKNYDFIDFDPVGLGDLLQMDLHSQTETWFEGTRLQGPSTPKQQDILRRFMIDATGMDKSECSKVIDGLFKTQTPMYIGDASPAQVRLLRNLLGVDPPRNITKAMASLLIQKKKEELSCEAKSQSFPLF
jgi:superfamily II DNA or RNA helicase